MGSTDSFGQASCLIYTISAFIPELREFFCFFVHEQNSKLECSGFFFRNLIFFFFTLLKLNSDRK